MTHPAQAINVDLLRPTSQAAYPLLEGAHFPGPEAPSLLQGPQATFQFRTIGTPLVGFTAAGAKQIIVDRISGFDFGFSGYLFKNLLVGGDLSVYGSTLAGQSMQVGVGDMRLLAKVQVLPNSSFISFALMPELYLPTGKASLFVGDGKVGGGLKLLAERNFGIFSLVANGGFVFFPSSQYLTIDQSYQFPIGLGARVPVAGGFAVDLSGGGTFLAAGSKSVAATDYYLGASYHFAGGVHLTLGGSLSGIQSQDSSTSFRMIAGLKVSPFEKPAAAPSPAPAPVAEARSEYRSETTIIRETRGGGVCGVTPYAASFSARELTAREMKQAWVLPYVAGSGRAMETLPLGRMNGLGKNDFPIVRDSQVLFAVDLKDLPARNSVIALQRASLELDVKKSEEGDAVHDAEILCLLNQKICSGELPRGEDWKANVNREFFGNKETPNDYFARRLSDRKVKDGNHNDAFAAELSLELGGLIENSLQPDALTLLYQGQDPDRSPEKITLYFAVASRTFVSPRTRMTLTFKTDSCLRGKKAPKAAKSGRAKKAAR